MTNKHLSTLFLVLAALSALFGSAGCGGDEEAEASLTKAQLGKRANLICSDAGNEQFSAATKYLSSHPGTKEEDVIELGFPPLEKALDELEALSPPERLEAKFAVFTEEFKKALEAMEREPRAALSPQENPFKKVNKLAEELELGDCSLLP